MSSSETTAAQLPTDAEFVEQQLRFVRLVTAVCVGFPLLLGVGAFVGWWVSTWTFDPDREQFCIRVGLGAMAIGVAMTLVGLLTLIVQVAGVWGVAEEPALRARLGQHIARSILALSSDYVVALVIIVFVMFEARNVIIYVDNDSNNQITDLRFEMVAGEPIKLGDVGPGTCKRFRVKGVPDRVTLAMAINGERHDVWSRASAGPLMYRVRVIVPHPAGDGNYETRFGCGLPM